MKKESSNKVKINSCLLVVSFFLLIGIACRMAQLSLFKTIDGINLQKLASSRTTKVDTLAANRGTIYDAKGNILAQNILSYTVIAHLDPKRSDNKNKLYHVVDKIATAEKLAPLLNMSASYIESLLKRKDIVQVELGPGGRGITELTKEKIMALELPGISFVESRKRYYPNGRFLSQVIGYAKNNEDEIIGELGLESYYDDMLKGIDGYLQFQRDRNGYQIPNTKEVRLDPIDGVDIYLTIDSNIQLLAERAVSESFTKYNPEWMLMVIADAKTGKILASTSYPSFDPNIRDMTNYLDPVVSYAFEPGSTMKIFTYMAAMESGKYKGTDTLLSGTIKIGNDTVKDFNTKGWGVISFDAGFSLSSNVGVTNLVQKYINGTILKDYFLKLGFGAKTGINLPKEVSGIINFKYPIEIATAGFGQGITTTPIQFIQALTPISNNGMMLKPYIIEKIIDPKGTVIFRGGKEEVEQVATLTTITKIKELMYNVIALGPGASTGYSYKIEGIDLIGKTGTAQIADGKGGYLEGSGNMIRSFAGLYPKEDPSLIIYAAAKKAPSNVTVYTAVKTVVENTAKYLNIIKDDTSKEDIITYPLPSFLNKSVTITNQTITNKQIPITILGNGSKVIDQYPKANVVITNKDRLFLITNDTTIKMPNIIGWSSREVLTLINLLGIDYEFEGYGFVTKQSISFDTLLNPTDKLVVTLKPKYDFE